MLLLDTNALLWLSEGSEQLGPAARSAIEEGLDEGAAFSAISIWETALLVRKGRYVLGQPVESWRADLLDAGFSEAPLDGLTCALAVTLDGLGDDPADRFIAAASARLGARLVTSDRRMLDWARARESEPIDARV